MRTFTPEQVTAAVALPDKWITPGGAAHLLSVGLRSIWRLTAQGKIPPPVRFSRKLVRWDRAALIEHLRRLAERKAAPLAVAPRPARPTLPQHPGPIEPRTPCPTCGKALWSMRGRKTGAVEVYCPNCIRLDLGEAS
jgi:predicted DNA-binding transcriptional regulator AlpA